MKHLLNILFIFFIVSHSSLVDAKENKDLMKANYYYSHGAFHDAIPFYEKVADDLKDPAVYAQLGECYQRTYNFEKAAPWYYKALKIKGYNPVVLLKYGQVLMQLNQYSEATRYLKEYLKYTKGDKRVANLIAGCAYAEKMKKEIPSGTAILSSFNTDGSEFAPAMWNGRLVFTSDTIVDLKKKTDKGTGTSYLNIYSVSCDNKGNCGNDVTLVTDAKKLNIKYHNGPATFSADGKEMYYTRSKFNDNFFSHKSVSNKDSVVLLEIMIASGYDTVTKEFRKITPFEYNSDDYTVAHPSVSPNGKVLVFCSNMPKGYGGCDLYICRKAGDKWGKPQNAGSAINTEGEEQFPYWADDNTLYFSSDGHQGLGGFDIYKSHFDEKTGVFSAVENVGMPLNSSYDDISLAMYADGRSTYFSSNRPAAKAGDNIYFYKREKVFLQVTVTDSVTGKSVPGVKVMLNGPKDLREIDADKNGKMFTQLYPGTQYDITASKDEYGTKQLTVNATGNKDKEVDTIFKEIQINKLVRDSIPPAKPVEQVVVKHESVIDSPGIQTFEVNKVYEIGHFYYEFDKYELTDAHQRFLDTLEIQLNRHPTMRIEIMSHTDCRGSAAYNKVLSNNRALSVVNYLVRHGISRKRLEYIGLGFSAPTVKCPDCNACTEEQHYLNRILEFKVLQL